MPGEVFKQKLEPLVREASASIPREKKDRNNCSDPLQF